MATLVTRYVNPHSSGGDGTTAALSGANAAYSSLNAWNAARARNLVTADEIEEVICATEGNADTATVTLTTAWTTDATRYPVIRAAVAHRARTAWTAARYRLETNAAFVDALNIQIPYCTVEGLQIRNIHADGHSAVGINSAALRTASHVRLTDLFLVGGLRAGNAYIVNQTDGRATYTNVVGVGGAAGGFRYSYSANGPPEQHFRNCVCLNSGGTGFLVRGDGESSVKNCYSGGNATADYAYAGSTAATNYSEDGTESTSTAALSTSTGTRFTNITAGSEDVALLAGSALIGVGTDLSGEFTTDILGTTRDASWDVGPYEYVESGIPWISGAGVQRRVEAR